MQVTSTAVVKGYFLDKYGKRGTQHNAHGTPDYSIPFTISEAPQGTVCFAVIFDDRDAIPVCGHTWIHWTIADLTATHVKDNASREDPSLIQGVTSWFGSESKAVASHYGGMCPPDRDHVYELRIYALDAKTELQSGFPVEELYAKLEGHVLATATLRGIYRK